MQVDVSAALGAGASATVLLGGLAGAYYGLRRWVQRAASEARNAASDAKDAAHQLQTSNGTTVAGYVERVDAKLDEIQHELTALTGWQAEVRDIASEARTLARSANERLDAHLLKHE